MHSLDTNTFEVRALVCPDSIVVATDRADTGSLVPYAVAQARASHAHVTLVSAITPGTNVPVASASPYVDMAKVENEVRKSLREQAAAIEAQGVPCDVYVECGMAVDVISSQLRRTRARRLIMGTHGRGKLGRLTLGSVASELLRTVQIPVFAVGPHAHGLQLHVTPERILHPVSFEGDYERGLAFAVEMARISNAELSLLLVLNRNDKNDVNPARAITWGRNALTALTSSMPALQKPVHVQAVFGRVHEEICNMAKMMAADLIVIGVSGAISFSPVAQNTAYKVLASAECPVMTAPHELHVREPAHEESIVFSRVPVGSGF